MKQNCWEFKKCGREQNGEKVPELGICPVYLDVTSDGMNGGICAGRICWAITGSLCGGKRQGTFAQKQYTCLNCDFFKKVKEEEGRSFKVLRPDQKYEAAS
jgi:hypothetical protein